MISRLCTKAVVSLIAISLIVPSALLFSPVTAQADSSGSCASVVAGAIASIPILASAEKFLGVTTSQPSNAAGQALGAGSSFGTFFSNCILKPLAIKLAKAMLQNITQSIVNWINSGFNGNPSFVQDLNGLVNDTTDQVIGNFIQNDLHAGFLCNSFSLQVKIALAQSYLPYQQRATCTLKQITNNVSGFVQSDNSGGWDNWLQVTTVPQNNVYGATILAQNELSQRVTTKLGVQNRQLDWGKGFRSWQTCETDQQVIDKLNAKSGAYAPKDTSWATKSVLDAARTCMTNTPGTVVESQLELSLGTGVRQLELANDLDAIAGALTNQLMSQVITGAKGLLGAGKSSSGSYTPTTYTAALAAQTNDTGLSSAIDTGVAQSVQDANLQALFTTDVGTSTPTATSTGAMSVDSQGNTVSTNTISLMVSSSTPFLLGQSAFEYDVNLSSNSSMSGLSVKTTLRKDGAAIPFLTPFSLFKVSFGRTDGTIVTQYIHSTTDGSAAWSNVSVDAGIPFVFRWSGTTTANAPKGVYTIETAVSDSSGSVLQVETDTFTIQ